MKKLVKVLLMFILTLTMALQYMPISATSDGKDNGQGAEKPVTPSETPAAAPQVTADPQVQTSADPNTDKNTLPDTTDVPVTDTAEQTRQPHKPTADPVQTEVPVQKTVTDNSSTPAADEVQQNTTDSEAKDAVNGIQAAAKMNLNELTANNTGNETTYVKSVSFNVVSDGTDPFDEDSQPGDDNDNHNQIVRSYDQMKYEIVTGYQADKSVDGKNLYYAVTIRDDDQLQLDWSSSGLATDVTPVKNPDGTKTYTFSFPIKTQSGGATASGEIRRDLIFNVLGMKNGDQFQPTVRCWFENNSDNTDPDTGKPAVGNDNHPANTATSEQTTVTTAPAYNIILKKGGSGSGKNVFHFHSDDSKNLFDGTEYEASAYGNTVNGYGITWGVAVEMRKTDAGKGIRGVEYPDPNQDLTFDVDISDAEYDPDGNAASVNTTQKWQPLLYRVRPNHGAYGDHTVSGGVPGSNQANESDPSKFCYNSGTYQVSQKGNILHFKIRGYQIDRSKFPKTSFDGNEYYYTDPQKIQEGVFTSAQFTVVYPMVNSKGEDIQNQLGESGNYKFNAKAENLSATSVYGTTAGSETVTTDNVSEITANVVGGHGHSHQIFFSHKNGQTTGSDLDSAGSQNNKNNDSDSATAGSQIFFTTDWSESNSSIAYPVEKRTVAADQLVLVEGDAIEITAAARQQHEDNTTRGYYLFPMYVTAAQPLSFNETKKLTMKSPELSYYSDLNEAKKHGSVVGVLLRWRGISYSFDSNGNAENGDGALLVNQTVANITNKADDMGKVYAITVQSELYDTDILPEVKNAFTEGETDGEKADAYRNAAKELLGNGPLCAVYPGVKPEPNGSFDNRSSYESKPTYNENGYNTGSGFGTDRADSLYVVPYYTQITKTVAQKDQNGNQKNTFNQDKAERYVDYKLMGTLSFDQGGMNYADGNKTTQITITDKIPAGLTYVKNSAVWGADSYEESAGKPGVFNGGEQTEPESVKNSDGSVTLTWKIDHVKVVSGELPSLYYTCLINNKAKKNASLQNTAEIWSSDEHRMISSYNRNISEAAVQITRSSAFNINKFGDHDLELNEKDKTFTLVASNSQDVEKTNFLMVDSMPYDGKDAGAGQTVMKGNYNVTGITIDDNPDVIGNDGANDIHIYYTGDEKYAGVKDMASVPADTVKQWTEAKRITKDGEDPCWNVTGWPTAIAIIDDNLGAYDSIFATIHYEATADKGDHLFNFLMTQGGNSTISSKTDAVIYDRSLSGTVWIDDDFDGLMDEGEEKVTGVKVQLMKQDTDGKWNSVESFKDTSGRQCSGTQYTDEKGYYSFDKLPEGNYKVVFTSGDTEESDLSQYYLTNKKAGTDDRINSKTDAAEKTESGKLKEGNITDISMPTIEKMKADGISHYELPDQNMGLYRVRRTISGTAWFDANGDGIYQRDVSDNTKEYPMAGVEVSLYHKDKDGRFVPYKVSEKEVRTTTDGEGHYVFEKLPEGEYEVIFSDGKGNDSRISEFNVTKTDQGTDAGTRSVAEAGEAGTAVVSRQNGSTDGIDLLSDQNLIDKKQSQQRIDNLNAGFVPKPVDISITKVWNDENNKDGIRPDTETFRSVLKLERFRKDQKGKASGEAEIIDAEAEVKDNRNNTYTVTYNGLLSVSYDGKAFTYYVYKIKEESINGYSADVKDAGDGEKITNTHKPSGPATPAKPSEPETPEEPGTPVASDIPSPVPSESPQLSETPVSSESPAPSVTPETGTVHGDKDGKISVSSSPKPEKQEKKSEAPDTGDHSHTGFYAGLLGLCVVFIIWRMVEIRKEQHNG